MKNILIILCLFLNAKFIYGQNLFILNKTKNTVAIELEDLLEIGAPPYKISTGFKMQKIPLNEGEPTMLGLQILPNKGPWGGNHFICCLFKPNDTIIIESNKIGQPIISHVSSAQRSKELSVGLEFLNKPKVKSTYDLDLLSFALLLNTNKYPVPMRDRILDSLDRPIINEVDIYCKKNNIDTNIAQIYKLNYLGKLIEYKLYFDNWRHKGYKDTVNSFYKDSLATWIKYFDNDKCINVPNYKNAIFSITNLLFEKNTPAQYLEQTATILKGNTRDFVLSRYIYTLLGNKPTEAENLMPRYNDLCQNQRFKDLIKSEYEFTKTKIGKNVSTAYLIDENKRQISFNDLIAKFKNKLIYIDFWASWCMPCMQEMPYSNTLRNKQANNPNIKFVYLSLDASFSSWKSANNTNALKNESSYLLTKYAKERLEKKLGIDLNAIPRYVIISKNGIIINKDAPRPSDEAIYNTLVKLAK